MNRPMILRRATSITIALASVGTTWIATAQTANSGDETIVVHRPSVDPDVLAYRSSLSKGRPPNRGFRAAILNHADDHWPFDEPGDDAPAVVRDAASLVATRLARDGLPATLVRVVESLGPDRVCPAGVVDETLLRQVGLPTDLISCWTVEGGGTDASPDITRFVCRLLASGRPSAEVLQQVANARFQFRPTQPGFRVATESGEHDVGLVRLQCPKGSYWRGPGDGSSLDTMRQLVSVYPEARFLVSVGNGDLDGLAAAASEWPLGRPGRFRIVAEPRSISQWAQDNTKAGLLHDDADSPPKPASLAPRFASRGEVGSIFEPEDTFLLDGVASTGHAVVHSPLLFQGGNLIPVRDPATGERIMLAGEAEIHRNTALGLTAHQAAAALCAEFGVDRCVVLPAASFHIDFEVCVRAVSGRLVAFVNDSPAAARIVLTTGLEPLRADGVLDPAEAAAAAEHLRAGRDAEALAIIRPRVFAQTDPERCFPTALTDRFASGPMESGAGNFQVFLMALDVLTSLVVPPRATGEPWIAPAYFEGLRRREAVRRVLRERLAGLGWTVVGVPSLSDADRGANYLNGIHERRRYIMPALGGHYAPLDQAAAAAFQAAMEDDVEIVPVYCATSQRSFGAVRCSSAVYPRTR